MKEQPIKVTDIRPGQHVRVCGREGIVQMIIPMENNHRVFDLGWCKVSADNNDTDSVVLSYGQAVIQMTAQDELSYQQGSEPVVKISERDWGLLGMMSGEFLRQIQAGKVNMVDLANWELINNRRGFDE